MADAEPVTTPSDRPLISSAPAPAPNAGVDPRARRAGDAQVAAPADALAPRFAMARAASALAIGVLLLASLAAWLLR
jgi:hypothetical protein